MHAQFCMPYPTGKCERQPGDMKDPSQRITKGSMASAENVCGSAGTVYPHQEVVKVSGNGRKEREG